MAVILIVVSCIVLGLCLTEGGGKKAFLGVLAALISFPFGVVLALTKKYK